MNNPPKFRFWSTNFKKWIQPRLWVQGNNDLIAELEGAGEIIIQQFTGVLDKNEKPIFEGDFVKILSSNVSIILCGEPNYTRGEVIWLCESWKICQKIIGASYLGDYISCNCCPAQIKVIGNILENPELKNE